MMTPKQEAEEIISLLCGDDCTIDNIENSTTKGIAIVDKIIQALEHHEWQNKEYIQHYCKVKEEMFKL